MAAPPVDAPAPSVQDAATAAGGFAPSATAASLCGFKIPLQTFAGLLPKLPAIPAIPKLPIPRPAIAFNCNLDNPISISAKPWGGGRTSTATHDPDNDFDDLSPGA